MTARKKFFGTWKSSLPIVSASFASLILVVVEEVIQSEFKCPQRKDLRISYGLSFFLFPAFILFLLSLIFYQDFIDWARCSKECKCIRVCEIVGKAFGFSFLWCVILLIDGRYSDCIHTGYKESKTEPTAQPTPAQPPSEAYVTSQICGLACLCGIILVYCIFTLYPLWYCCKSKEERKKIENQLILEEETEICISKDEKYVQAIVQNTLVSKFQDHLKNVASNLSVKDIIKEVKKILNPSAAPTTTEAETGM